MTGDGDLLAAQRARFTAIDPALPEAVPPPRDERTETLTAALPDGRRVTAGLVHASYPVGSAQRLWSAAEVWELLPLIGDTGGVGMNALLCAWVERMRAVGPPTSDSTCLVSWPSRDTEATRAFLDHGFLPLTTLAVRRSVPQPPPRVDPLVVRLARNADMDAMLQLTLAELRYSAAVGAATFRENAVPVKRDALRKRLLDGDPVWVAERDGMTLALADCVWTPVTKGNWAGTRLRPGNWGYVNCVSVLPGARGNGVGRRLMDVVHAEFARGGATGTYLYYNPPNPLSSVFWPRQGYRPLWTLWEVRPATALR
ncbi:GNAT family N-acetyltransferase [Allokutzneria albata]|uniref:Acetyltransferase (GNAT) family protein n=1 Tax=Allokutzneria albata TaxID=211114 RepID=A0A1G9W1N4_ALLAB|nr:GNAT family N-acetyltransferase [Allokutzneria albata]SDM78410.1 Acetyltransferase (GNAT) family protein [Allokutzneria albata]